MDDDNIKTVFDEILCKMVSSDKRLNGFFKEKKMLFLQRQNEGD